MNTTPIRKRALVTGGSGGIGAAICRQLAADGFHVIVHANRHLEAAQTVVDAIQAAGGQAQALAFDITDATATTAALETLLAQGPIQVLVNNAGIHDDAIFPGMQLKQWQQVPCSSPTSRRPRSTRSCAASSGGCVTRSAPGGNG